MLFGISYCCIVEPRISGIFGQKLQHEKNRRRYRVFELKSIEFFIQWEKIICESAKGHTVLPQLVSMRTIKLLSVSGFVLIERAYYPRGRTIKLFTS